MANVFHFEIFLKFFLVFFGILVYIFVLASQAPKKLSQTLFYFSFLLLKTTWEICGQVGQGGDVEGGVAKWQGYSKHTKYSQGKGQGGGVHRVTSCICMVSYCMYVSHIFLVYFANTHASHTHSYTQTHTHMLAQTFIKYAAYAVRIPVPCSQFPIPVPCYCYCSCSLFLTSSTFFFLLGTTSLYTKNYPKPPDKKTLSCWPSLSLCLSFSVSLQYM